MLSAMMLNKTRADTKCCKNVKGEGDFREALIRFCFRYKKAYETVSELKHRFAIYVDSLKLVERHNKEGHSYTLAINGMSLTL